MAVQYKSYLKDVQKARHAAAEKGLLALGMYIEDQAIRNITREKAVDTGQLRSSLTHEVDMNDLSVSVGTNVKYAVYVELGTGIYADNGRGRSKPWAFKDRKGQWHFTRGQKPRKFLTNAFLKNHDAMERVFSEAYGDEMKLE